MSIGVGVGDMIMAVLVLVLEREGEGDGPAELVLVFRERMGENVRRDKYLFFSGAFVLTAPFPASRAELRPRCLLALNRNHRTQPQPPATAAPAGAGGHLNSVSLRAQTRA